jgi:hypothetical protein
MAIRFELRKLETFADKEFNSKVQLNGAQASYETGLVFLIMPFVGKGCAEAEDAYKSECMRVGLRCIRVDDRIGSGIVFREIVELIEKAEFIVCDLSWNRPNVYYELGYAHGVGNDRDNIFLTARKGTRLHFDLAPIRVHYYESNEQLRVLIRTRFHSLVEAKAAALTRS